MDCAHLDPLIEAFSDGTLEAGAAEQAHLDRCDHCRLRLEDARAIERLLMTRDTPAPSPGFTTGVMMRILEQRWSAERVVDVGFNLAVAAGLLVMLAAGAGLAWSLGLLTISIDVGVLLDAAGSIGGGRVINGVQTVTLAAGLLTMALGLWWWAEADSVG